MGKLYLPLVLGTLYVILGTFGLVSGTWYLRQSDPNMAEGCVEEQGNGYAILSNISTNGYLVLSTWYLVLSTWYMRQFDPNMAEGYV